MVGMCPGPRAVWFLFGEAGDERWQRPHAAEVPVVAPQVLFQKGDLLDDLV